MSKDYTMPTCPHGHMYGACIMCYHDLVGEQQSQIERLTCELERANGRRRQARKVMPLIGPLLDAWLGLPNDVANDRELDAVRHYMERINSAMEDA